MQYLRQLDVDRLHRGLRTGAASRRDIMAAAAAAGLAFATSTPRLARAEDGQMITFFTWGGYDIPELHQSFVDAHGAPNLAQFGGTEEALAKIRGGYSPDLTHPCLEDMLLFYDSGVLAPVDPARISYWGDIFPQMLEAPGASFDGEPYLVPFDWGNSSILYRTDLVEVEEESWCMLFDERYKGKIAARNSIANVRAAAACLGFDIFRPTEEQLSGPIADMLRQQRDLVPFYWDDQTSAEQSIASGETVMMYAWNSAYVALKEQGLPVAYANPKEGIWTWMCGMVRIDTGEGDEALTYDFIDAMLAPETGKWLIENYGYGHSNRESFAIADPAALAELGLSDPLALFERGIFFAPGDPKIEERMVELFDNTLAGF